MKWVDLRDDEIECLFVFLLIRGLGKSKALLHLLSKMENKQCSSAEQAVLRLINIESLTPSMRMLDSSMVKVLKDVFQIHDTFNFGQMLQGENLPSNVLDLQHLFEEHDTRTLKFYLVSLVGIFSGLAGTQPLSGSLFMTRENASNVIRGIFCLQSLMQSSAHTIYWSYTSGFARHRHFMADSIEDLLIAKLTCLSRAKTDEDCAQVRQAWGELNESDRSVLAEHLIADGIETQAIHMVFLPTLLENVRMNKVLGLRKGLVVLVDLIETLRGALPAALKTVTVDLTDLSTLAKDACDSNSFELFSERLSIDVVGKEVRITMRKGAARGTIEAKMEQVSCKVKQLLRAVSSL